MECAWDLRSTELGEPAIESSVEDIPHLRRIDSELDLRENLVGASHEDDGLGIVLSFSPVAQFGTALLGIACWLRLFSTHDLLSICYHHYSPHFLVPHGVVVLGQLKDVGINAPEGFSRHCAGGWCFRGFGGLVKAGEHRL